MKKNPLYFISPLLGIFFLGIALFILHKELSKYHYQDIVQQLENIPFNSLIFAVLFSALSYFVMTGYDKLAFVYVKHPLSYGKIAFAAFISDALSNNIGFAALSEGGVQYRLYSQWGLSSFDIAKAIAFSRLPFWLGLFAIGGIVFLISPLTIPTILNLPFVSVRSIGVVFLLAIIAFLIWLSVRKEPLNILGWEFEIPSLKLLLSITLLASLDWIFMGSILYVLLPSEKQLYFPYFLGIYVLAEIAGMVSQVPGGLGVFETVILIFLKPLMPTSVIVAALFSYRLVYYIFPLLIAALLLGLNEIISKKEEVKRFAIVFGKPLTAAIPNVLAFNTFIAGIILLFSGSTPSEGERLLFLKDFIPLSVIETSHFLGSVAGMCLLLLSWGLLRKLDASYILTVILLSAGIIFSLLKGFDYEEATALTIMLFAILPCKKYFYRKSSFLNEQFKLSWILSVYIVLICSIWLGFFSYKHVNYSHDLWWSFALSGDAPRFLRASVGAVSILLVFALAKLLRPALPALKSPNEEDNVIIKNLVKKSKKTSAYLALTGDKYLLFSENKDAFIMYGVEGKSWVAVGDPVGSKKEIPELIWQFVELANQYEGWAVFYEIEKESLHLYLEPGLVFFKLGEEAKILLENFSLEGSSQKGLRHSYNKVQKAGYEFEVIPSHEVSALLPQLKVVSDSWLSDKSTREKRFTFGSFKEDYLKQLPIAIVKKEGKIIAFANIWTTECKEEVSIDLMRYVQESSGGVMDYLLIELMMWAKKQGYKSFNMGMSPLSGLEGRGLAPLWDRIGSFIFKSGENFYNFQGLRQYKEKFNPIWEPKYIACPGGLLLPQILINISSLVAGGLKGVFAK